MAWLELTPTLLKTHLARAELDALASVQLPNNVDAILQSECTNWANVWRGKIRLFHTIDKRSNYVPESLLEYILCHVRYSCYTRLPAMGELLDDLRRREWERANDVLDNIRKYYVDAVEEGEEEDKTTNNPEVIIDNDSWKFETVRPPRPKGKEYTQVFIRGDGPLAAIAATKAQVYRGSKRIK